MEALAFLVILSLQVGVMTEQCNSLVLYDDSKVVLKRFREKTQLIEMGDWKFRLEQDWNGNGVAGVLWDSAIVLSRYLLENTEELVRDKRVLELGAGLGLPSLVTTKFGARQVIATDQKSGLPLLQKNSAENLSPEEQSRLQISELDWVHPQLGSEIQFDVILGADLVYNKDVFEPLQSVLESLISPETICLFSSKIRYSKDRKFYVKLARKFNVEEIYYEKTLDVTLFRITRKE